MKTKHILLFALSAITLSSCFDDQDDSAPDSSIQDFVWRGLNFWSLYKADVPDLADDRFENTASRTQFLNRFETPQSAFNALTSDRDRFSILRDDYLVLENSLSGIRTSSGMRLSLFKQSNDPSKYFGVVRYVVNNSPAQDAGVRRGMIFTAVDGVELTENSDLSAIFSPEQYTINLATENQGDFTLTGENIIINKIELAINPVHIAKTITIAGETEKIGYLHYTGFTRNYDADLNAAFAQFKADDVKHLVLDLRYNGGGSIESANDLCAMVTGQFENDVFITQEYNEDRNPDVQFTRRFNDVIGDGSPINSLNLNKVYVLTTERTASASELIISGLMPYINVVQIGTSTTGKFEGSFLLYDAPAPNFRREEANPSHRYVMLPLVLRSVNANGLTDYFDGFSPEPNLLLNEDPLNMGVLGDVNEPLLKLAIDEIFPGFAPNFAPYVEATEQIFNNEQLEPAYQRMYAEPSFD